MAFVLLSRRVLFAHESAKFFGKRRLFQGIRMASTAEEAAVDQQHHKQPENPTTVKDFYVKDIKGNDVKVGDYLDGKKAALIVNVASKCGFTKQYEGLQSLYQTYQDKGFTVLGFPCNQFMGQEPGTDEQIQEFACSRFKVSFPLFSKINVNGNDAHPLYEYMKKERPGLMGSKGVKWNFTKFLVDGEGKVIKRFSPNDEPASLEKDLKPLLE
eukprot:gb/GECG01002172.1/.p1 GENE.gb/GECG01002172.1/~~gb/GECG01002172.1/.p1  ORF type:complete len:213 (+),score=30.42 gb/GECG01002172.1/:1-639(+)